MIFREKLQEWLRSVAMSLKRDLNKKSNTLPATDEKLFKNALRQENLSIYHLHPTASTLHTHHTQHAFRPSSTHNPPIPSRPLSPSLLTTPGQPER